MTDAEEYLSIMMQAQSYKGHQLALIYHQGEKDCCIQKDLIIMSMYLTIIAQNGTKLCLDDAALEGITSHMNNIIGAPGLGGVTNNELTLITYGIVSTAVQNIFINQVIIIHIDYTAQCGKKLILVDCRLNPVTIYIPDAYLVCTDALVIKDVYGYAETNNITIQMTGAGLIDGATSYVMNIDYQGMDLWSDTHNLYIA